MTIPFFNPTNCRFTLNQSNDLAIDFNSAIVALVIVRLLILRCARVAELADALDSGSSE
jgi:hypothetical protein